MNEEVRGPASCSTAIEKTSGKPIAAWSAAVRERIAADPEAMQMALVGWLESEHGMGHGHADAVVAHTLAEDRASG